jgi:hypothetical protein
VPSIAGEALGVSRKTVDNRIRAVESHVGRQLSTFAAELEIGLSLDQLVDLT